MCNTTCITHVEKTQPIEPITLHLHITFVKSELKHAHADDGDRHNTTTDRR